MLKWSRSFESFNYSILANTVHNPGNQEIEIASGNLLYDSIRTEIEIGSVTCFYSISLNSQDISIYVSRETLK